MDDFGIKYVGKQHAVHLLNILEQHYKISAEWEGGKFVVIDLAWNYDEQHAKRTCCISMNGYIYKLLMKYGNSRPSKAQLSQHKHREVTYGSKEQLNPEEDKSPPLDKYGTKRIQVIVGALLYYAIAVDNKLLFGLISIGSQQAAATECTDKSITKLLDYSATYAADGILYRSSDIIICGHSDSGFHKKSKGRSRSGSHIFLSEKNPMPRWDVPVLTLAQIIKNFMSSASEEELGALFITAQEIVEMRNTLEEMRWTHPKSPIQIENSASAGVVNNNIFPRKLKTMYRRFHWLICRESQGQF